MAVNKENADGSVSIVRERDSLECSRAGGVAGPAGSNTPSYIPGSSLSFNFAGGTDTGGGILSWQNTLGYDIIVTWHAINVTTKASAACTISIGQTATSATTLSSNMINGQDVGTAAGVFGTSSPVAIKVKQNEWITASKASGASAGLVGCAYFYFIPATA